jgi:FSR family fosmidomycin resistance protein-like MFS transporter
MDTIKANPDILKKTTYSILFIISFSHLINDLLQAVVPFKGKF